MNRRKKMLLSILTPILMLGLTGCTFKAYVDYGTSGKILTHKEVLRDKYIKKDIKDGHVKYKEGDTVKLYKKTNTGSDYVIFKNYDGKYLTEVQNTWSNKFESYLNKINFPYEKNEYSYEDEDNADSKIADFERRVISFEDTTDEIISKKIEEGAYPEYYSFAKINSLEMEIIGHHNDVHHIEGTIFLKLDDLNSFDLNKYPDFKALLEDLRGLEYTDKEIEYINSKLTEILVAGEQVSGFNLKPNEDILHHELMGVDKNIRDGYIYYNIKHYNIYR